MVNPLLGSNYNVPRRASGTRVGGLWPRPERPGVALDDTVAQNYTLSVKEIVYSREAVRTLARMPRNLAGRVREKIRAYADDAASQTNNVSRLRGPGQLLRLRVGDWRIVMHDADRLEILHVTTRGSAYKE